MVRPRASSATHRLPDTTWLSRVRTSHPSHGVGSVPWSAPMPATTPRVASSAWRWCAAMSAMPSPCPWSPGPCSALHVGELLGHLAVRHPDDVDAAHVAAAPAVAPELDHAVTGGEGVFGVEAARGIVEDRLPGLADCVDADVAGPPGGRGGGGGHAAPRPPTPGPGEGAGGPRPAPSAAAHRGGRLA